MTRRFVDASGRITILDTRKTRTCAHWRNARCAPAACNHRIGLFDAILIRTITSGSPVASPQRSRAPGRSVPSTIEVEAQTLAEVDDAIRGGRHRPCGQHVDRTSARRWRLPAEARSAAGARGRARWFPAASRSIGSGSRHRRRCVSVGALTHSAPAVDISFGSRLCVATKTRKHERDFVGSHASHGFADALADAGTAPRTARDHGHLFPTIGSTNDVAATMLATEGAVVIADARRPRPWAARPHWFAAGRPDCMSRSCTCRRAASRAGRLR